MRPRFRVLAVNSIGAGQPSPSGYCAALTTPKPVVLTPISSPAYPNGTGFIVTWEPAVAPSPDNRDRYTYSLSGIFH